jgi:DNA-binding transcriptional LysR family regulator
LDDLKSMSVFIQVVDQGSLSAAAEREGISPTMAGNHLRALERKLGAKLLNRTTRRHSLTEVGQTYYDQARTILQLVAQAHAGVEAAQAKPRGRLRITAPVSFGAERLTPALGEFLAQNREISIDLTLSDRVGDLIDDGFDAAVRIGELSDSGLVARQLQHYRMWVCAAPSYLRERGTPARPQELEGHDCLLFSYAGGQWRFGQSDRSPKVRVHGRLQVNNGQALRMAARAGLGIIMQPEVLLAEDVAEGRLVRLFSACELPGRPMNLVYLSDRQMPPKLRSFIDFVVAKFGMA